MKKVSFRNALRQVKYSLWALNGFLSGRFRLDGGEQVTVLITYFNPSRMLHINHQIRNIAKCDFVDRIIISNHNPDVKIESLVKVKDKRIIILNQDIRRGCGYRWSVAFDFSPEYLIVIDDDLLLFPRQIQTLAKQLVCEPEIPHGFAGMIQSDDGNIIYRETEDRNVDYLCEIYAITGAHLHHYMSFRNKVRDYGNSLAAIVESSADFILVSKSGNGKPKIHTSNRLFRCPTYNEPGVAVHKDTSFQKNILDVTRAID